MNKRKSIAMKRTIDEWIEIDAKPEEIWNFLIDFESWKVWNPFIPMVEGNLKVGDYLRIKVKHLISISLQVGTGYVT